VQKGGPGFGYGFVCAFCFTMAFFCLLCGLVLDGFKDTVQDELEVKREHPTSARSCAHASCLSGFCSRTVLASTAVQLPYHRL
jgi:hypothetical protein